MQSLNQTATCATVGQGTCRTYIPGVSRRDLAIDARVVDGRRAVQLIRGLDRLALGLFWVRSPPIRVRQDDLGLTLRIIAAGGLLFWQ